MQQFLASFSSSFLLALLVWPFLAAALTLPILIWQYRRYNKFSFWRAIMTYGFVLYGLALVSFTLYPMPDNPAKFCADYNLSPQLIPFASIMEISSEGLRAALQVGMNLLFFVPLGIFGKLLFRWKIWKVVLAGFVTSLLIETAQLTGAFGIYPCSYRLFDVDDLLLNTLGAILGYLVAMIVPQRELTLATKNDVVRQAGLLRYGVAFVIDQATVVVSSILAILILYLLIGSDLPQDTAKWLTIIFEIIVYMLMPLLAKGWSIGGKMVRLNHDNKQRSFWRRLLFYVARLVYILLIVALYDGKFALLVIIVTLIYWHKRKQLPYQFI